jgi:hypothetical protein
MRWVTYGIVPPYMAFPIVRRSDGVYVGVPGEVMHRSRTTDERRRSAKPPCERLELDYRE